MPCQYYKNKRVNATLPKVMPLKYLDAKLPSKSPFSSIPRFLDWYNNRLLLVSTGSSFFSRKGGIKECMRSCSSSLPLFQKEQTMGGGIAQR